MEQTKIQLSKVIREKNAFKNVRKLRESQSRSKILFVKLIKWKNNKEKSFKKESVFFLSSKEVRKWISPEYITLHIH